MVSWDFKEGRWWELMHSLWPACMLNELVTCHYAWLHVHMWFGISPRLRLSVPWRPWGRSCSPQVLICVFVFPPRPRLFVAVASLFQCYISL